MNKNLHVILIKKIKMHVQFLFGNLVGKYQLGRPGRRCVVNNKNVFQGNVLLGVSCFHLAFHNCCFVTSF